MVYNIAAGTGREKCIYKAFEILLNFYLHIQSLAGYLNKSF